MAVTKCNDGERDAILHKYRHQSIIFPSPFTANNFHVNDATKLSFDVGMVSQLKKVENKSPKGHTEGAIRKKTGFKDTFFLKYKIN